MNQESFTQGAILPICMHCNKIRNDREQWQFVDTSICSNLEVDFTHDICPDCAMEHYGHVLPTADA